MRSEIIEGHVLDRLREMPADSVQCVVTSPPYFGLRSYGTPPIAWGGDPGCQHEWRTEETAGEGYSEGTRRKWQHGATREEDGEGWQKETPRGSTCAKCGAWLGDLGREPTPDLYVEHMVTIFREVRRILRVDGTVWCNLGSSFASSIIESEHAVIREDVSDEEYRQALSTMWHAYAPAEPNLPSVLSDDSAPAGSLRHEAVREVRREVHPLPKPARDVLLPPMRSLREPDSQADEADSGLPDVRSAIHQVPGRDSEDTAREALLQHDLLVQLQPARQPLPVDWRSAREDEPRGDRMAADGPSTGQVSLPAVPCKPTPGGPSHPALRNASDQTVVSEQRPDALPDMPPPLSPSGGGIRRDPRVYRLGANGRLELSVPWRQVPPGVRHLFRSVAPWKPKDLVNIPHLVAEALRADGWWLRSDIVWGKPNPLPESVTDRPTRAHEYVFLLAKNARYFYDADAIREPLAESTLREIEAGYSGSATKDYAENGVQDPSAVKARIVAARRAEALARGDHPRNVEGSGIYCQDGAPGQEPHRGLHRAKTAGPGPHAGGRRQDPEPGEPGAFHPLGANRRTVWWIPTAQNPLAHFATFPRKLVEPCVMAGTSERGACATCGAPWTRDPTGWRPSCDHQGDPVPCLVLDPFAGSGTVGVVANLLGRSFVGIELKPEYAAMARKRIRRDGAPLFLGPA